MPILQRLTFLIPCIILVLVEVSQLQRQGRIWRPAFVALGVVAAAHILFIMFLWFNHIGFPLNLDLMEGTVLQHFRRSVEFKPIYPEPTPDYVPLAYNPLYYVLAIPFGWVFGISLPTLRLVSVLAMLGSGLILYRVVSQKTASVWWGLMAVGLFAAAYRAMDTYLDSAHSDAWLLFLTLLGSYLIDRNRSRRWNLVGVLLLVGAFWTKQHGALFAIGGVLFLTWREGPRRSIPYWLVAALLGPIAYVLVGPLLFGPRFLYFTWEVPRNWSTFDRGIFIRLLTFIAVFYPLLALSGTLLTAWTAVKERKTLNVWHVQFVFALMTGVMGSLDTGSANNVYIPMGTWFILVGTLGFYELVVRIQSLGRYRIHQLLLFTTFAVLLYDPRSVVASPRAGESFTDLAAMLNNLHGNVYAPTLGQLEQGYVFYPAAHWVALEDMVRGPGRDTRNSPLVLSLLEPALHPSKPAFVLENHPLENSCACIRFLTNYYVLDTDFGDRFEALRVLPKRFDHGWPRYLYRYDPQKAALQAEGNRQ
jgi:hypothetical protein